MQVSAYTVILHSQADCDGRKGPFGTYFWMRMTGLWRDACNFILK